MPVDDVVVNNIEHITAANHNRQNKSSVSSLFESEINIVNTNMDWVVFTPIFLSFGKPANNRVPTFVQQVYYTGKLRIDEL